MRFWDASAVVPLLIEEEATPELRRGFGSDSEIVVWWTTLVECASALARREREGQLELGDLERSLVRLDKLREQWVEVDPVESVRRTAFRLIRTHDLRAGDALQLAAALVASEDRPEALDLVTLDDRLALAASREGFRVVAC